MRRVRKQPIITALITFGLIVVFMVCCIGIQLLFACRRINERADHYFDSISEIYEAQVEVSEDVLHQKSETIQRLARCVAIYYDEETLRLALSKPPKEQTALLQKICNVSNVAYLIISDDEGKAVFANKAELNGVNLVESGFLEREVFERLLETEAPPADIIDSIDRLIYLESSNSEVSSYMPYVESLKADGVSYRVIVLADYEKVFGSVNTILLDSDLSLESESNDEFLVEIYPKGDDLEESFILYGKHRNRDYMLEPYQTIGFSREVLKEGYGGIQHLEDGFYYCHCHTVNSTSSGAETFFIFASSIKLMVDFSSLLLPVAVLAWFCIYLIAGGMRTKRGSTNMQLSSQELQRNPAKRFSTIAIIGTVCVFAVAFYGQTLSDLSLAIRQTRTGQDLLGSGIESVMELYDSFQESHEEIGVSQANLIRMMVEKYPDRVFADDDPYAYREYYVTDENGYSVPLTDELRHPLRSVCKSSVLQKLCEGFNMDRITLFNADGYTIADSGDQWYEHIERELPETASLFQVLDRKLESFVESDVFGDRVTKYAVPVDYYVCDRNGKTAFVTEKEYNAYLQDTENEPLVRHRYGLLICTQTIPDHQFVTEKKALAFVIDSREKAQNCQFLIAEAAEGHIITYADDDALIGTSADLILSENTFSGEHNGFFTWGMERYFICARLIDLAELGTVCAISIYSLPTLFGQRLVISASIGLACAILLALLAVLMIRRSRREITVSVEIPSGGDRPDRETRWLSGSLFVILLAGFIFLVSRGWKDSILRFILSGQWEHGINLFSLSLSGFMLLGLVLFSLLLQKLKGFFSLLNTRGETVILLIISTIKYGAGLFVIFYSLHLFGLDTASVLRSLGAFSLIVGLGAQSLIRDIIAGIFVVFEGSYRVGDIVKIKNFQGRVEEIALRTTKVRNLDGNMMIFSNSSIADVENLSAHNSCVYCNLQIPASCDPDEIKEKILRELPAMSRRIPEILNEIEYDGIVETNLNGYVIRLIARCHESNRGKLWRKMNYELISLQRKLNLK